MVDERTHGVVAVIEDDSSSRTALGRLLRAEGYETALFDSAEAYIAAPPTPAPVCLIVDFQLPGLSGMELQQRLRTEGSASPVIMITGVQEGALRDRAMQSGCAAFFRKPFESNPLLAAIASLAERDDCQSPGS